MSLKTSRVFLSHTSDLETFPAGRSFVQAALDAVARMGMLAIDMRYFAAQESPPAQYCRQRVRESDVYLAIVGFRYGSLVPGESVSYTELEFAEATLAGLPRLVFLLRDGVPGSVVDPDRTEVERFRSRLKQAGLICVEFTATEELELAVVQALAELKAHERTPPRQLPPAVAHFAGRGAELEKLTRMWRGRLTAGGTVVISAIEGTAGVGKTTLAVFWAHQVADQFPDGQLYVDLRGFDDSGQMVTSAEAVRRFLDALEVDQTRIPADLDGQVVLYRSLVAGRRMLVFLDNARDSGQVRPLLPGTPGCLVVVTSRNQLAGLVAAQGAHSLSLDLLTPSEARELLAGRLGEDRIAAEPDAVDEIIAACARLPLALAIVAARATNSPLWSLTALAAELREADGRLDMLASGEDAATDLKSVLSWSYRALTPAAQRLFRLLGLHPGPSASFAAAASLAGVPSAAARGLLTELARANLIAESALGRYTFHDLLRAYASDLVHREESGEARKALAHRMFDAYLHTANAADQLLYPGRDPLDLGVAQADVTVAEPATAQQAADWFDAERAVLVAVIKLATATGFDTHAWQLAWTLAPFLEVRWHWHDLAGIGRAAVDAASRLAEPAAQTYAHRLLARAYVHLGHPEQAHTELQHALDVTTRAGDREGQANIHYSLAYMWERQACYAEALSHAQQALELYRAVGHRRGEARALNNIGWCQTCLGDHEQAVVTCGQALELLEELGDRFGQGSAWDTLGHAHLHLHHHDLAVSCFQRAVDLSRELEDLPVEAETLEHLGDALHAKGDLDAAWQARQQALAIRAKLADLR